MYNKRRIGSKYEDIAIKYMMKNGYIIREKNFFCKCGEIDIIAYDNEYLVFAEVKYRSSIKSGYPQESVSLTKRKRIINTAKYYMYKNNVCQNHPIRFDVISILDSKILIIKDAFWIS